MVRQDLKDGQHRNLTDDIRYFTDAFFHRPSDFKMRLKQSVLKMPGYFQSKQLHCSCQILKKFGKMIYGARNNIQAKVNSIKKGDVMSLIKFDITTLTRWVQYFLSNQWNI